jgi:hypothetical protein
MWVGTSKLWNSYCMVSNLSCLVLSLLTCRNFLVGFLALVQSNAVFFLWWSKKFYMSFQAKNSPCLWLPGLLVLYKSVCSWLVDYGLGANLQRKGGNLQTHLCWISMLYSRRIMWQRYTTN